MESPGGESRPERPCANLETPGNINQPENPLFAGLSANITFALHQLKHSQLAQEDIAHLSALWRRSAVDHRIRDYLKEIPLHDSPLPSESYTHVTDRTFPSSFQGDNPSTVLRLMQDPRAPSEPFISRSNSGWSIKTAVPSRGIVPDPGASTVRSIVQLTQS
jgi:hypothetical protein